MRTYELDDIKILVGTSAIENWALIDDAKQNYVWMHLDGFPSPHVIIQADYQDVDKKILNYGASLCKLHSKYKNLKNLKIMYLPIKNVTKTKKPGEVTTKGKAGIIKI
jgi:predicted ribosome quality control (RQC) complex YloA/Tae2 family protein